MGDQVSFAGRLGSITKILSLSGAVDMVRAKTYLVASVVLVVLGFWARPALAATTVADTDDRRVPYCSIEHHLYGRIQAVRGTTVQAESSGAAGLVYLLISRATVRPVGMKPSAGLYFRAYGCFGENASDQNIFRTTYLTLGRRSADIRFISDRPSEDEMNSASSHKVASPPKHAQPREVVSTGGREDTQACSGYRWATKIGSDQQANAVTLTPQTTTIAGLIGMKPSAASSGQRINPVETTVYRLTNVMLQKRYTEHDNDYHLIVVDANGRSMTLEAPDPNCAGGSAFLSQIRAVRQYIDSNNVSAGSLLSVTGIGFYDPVGSGGIELHPLLSICAGRDCSPVGAVGTRFLSKRP